MRDRAKRTKGKPQPKVIIEGSVPQEMKKFFEETGVEMEQIED